MKDMGDWYLNEDEDEDEEIEVTCYVCGYVYKPKESHNTCPSCGL